MSVERRGGQQDWQNCENIGQYVAVTADKKVKDLLCDVSVRRQQHGGELFDEVRSVARLFELLDARDDHVIFDAIEVDLAVRHTHHVTGRGRWCVSIDSQLRLRRRRLVGAEVGGGRSSWRWQRRGTLIFSLDSFRRRRGIHGYLPG